MKRDGRCAGSARALSPAAVSAMKAIVRASRAGAYWVAKAIGNIEADRLVAYGTFVVAIATFALVIVTHDTDVKVGRQLNAFERQLALMENEQRPWVHLSSITLASPLVVSEGAARITIQFDLKNSGKSPAHFVIPIGSLISLIKNDAAVKLDKYWESCDALRSKPAEDLAGGVLFPGTEAPYTYFAEMDPASLDRWKSARTAALLIFGCADYVYADMTKHHQTRFVYALGKRRASELLPDLLDFTIGETPASDLLLIDHPALLKRAD